MVEETQSESQAFPFMEPWRCGECNALMYNTTEDGYPAPGAPVGLVVTINEKKIRVCWVCADLYILVGENDYMMKQHNDWIEEQKHKDRLRFGHNYLDRKD